MKTLKQELTEANKALVSRCLEIELMQFRRTQDWVAQTRELLMQAVTVTEKFKRATGGSEEVIGEASDAAIAFAAVARSIRRLARAVKQNDQLPIQAS